MKLHFTNYVLAMGNRKPITITENSNIFKSLMIKNLKVLYLKDNEGFKNFESYYKYKSDFLINAYKDGK